MKLLININGDEAVLILKKDDLPSNDYIDADTDTTRRRVHELISKLQAVLNQHAGDGRRGDTRSRSLPYLDLIEDIRMQASKLLATEQRLARLEGA